MLLAGASARLTLFNKPASKCWCPAGSRRRNTAKGSKKCQGRRSQPQANFSRTTGAKRPLQGEYRNPYPESCKAISDSNDLEAQVASPMWESTTKSNKTKGPVAAKATETCVGPSSHPGRELYHPGCNPWGSARADPCTDKKQKGNPPVVRWPRLSRVFPSQATKGKEK